MALLALGLAFLTVGRAEAAVMSFDIAWPAGRASTVQSPPQRVAAPVLPVCLVVQAPIKPTDYGKPAFDQPGFPAENPTGTPEPASLITGLLGGGVALTAWVRRRRAAGQAEDVEGPCPPGESPEAV